MRARYPDPTAIVLAYAQAAQRAGISRSTAYGAYRRAGGLLSRSRFVELWLAAAAADGAFPQRGVAP